MKALAAMIGASLAMTLVAYAVFIAARALVTALARVPGRLPPFGEAPTERLARASILTRLALTLAGPTAVYLLVTVLSTFGLHGSEVFEATNTTVEVATRSGPAAAAGVRDGDRIVAAGGEPVATFADLGPVLREHAGESVDLVVERDGRILHLAVTPGPVGSPGEGKIGVRHRPEPASFRTALRLALARPFRIVVGRVQTSGPRLVELSGPVGIVHETYALPKRSRAVTLANAAGLLGATALEGFLILALLMFPFRRRRAEPPEAEPAQVSAAASPPRPWVRWAARLVDITVIGLLLGLALIAVDPNLVEATGVFFIFLAIPIEAALLASWGYTPGKWLLGVSVRDASGRKLRFGAALRRAATAWTYGLGVNEATALVACPLALRRLRRRGSAYWDALDGHRVTHGPVREGRAVVAVVVIAALFAFVILVMLRSLGSR